MSKYKKLWETMKEYEPIGVENQRSFVVKRKSKELKAEASKMNTQLETPLSTREKCA